jgi:hypothetical protein
MVDKEVNDDMDDDINTLENTPKDKGLPRVVENFKIQSKSINLEDRKKRNDAVSKDHLE